MSLLAARGVSFSYGAATAGRSHPPGVWPVRRPDRAARAGRCAARPLRRDPARRAHNDLDTDGLELLERHLAGLRGGLVMVSHDRAFLERLASEVIQLDRHSHRAIRYGGGFAVYQAELERDRVRARAEYESCAARRGDLIQRARRQREWARSGEQSARSPAARRKEPDKNIRHARSQGAQQLGAGAASAMREADRRGGPSIRPARCLTLSARTPGRLPAMPGRCWPSSASERMTS